MPARRWRWPRAATCWRRAVSRWPDRVPSWPPTPESAPPTSAKDVELEGPLRLRSREGGAGRERKLRQLFRQGSRRAQVPDGHGQRGARRARAAGEDPEMVLRRRRCLGRVLHRGDAVLLSRLARALVLAALAVSPAAAQPRVETIATGLEVPWALAFAPDGRLFVTERVGRIRVVKDGRLEPAPVATVSVAAQGEAGLMGLALDPRFGDTGHLYVCYTAARQGDLVNRIVRLTLRDGRAGQERVLLDGMRGGSIHDGCRLKFGPDGKLYATMGDAGEPRLAQASDRLNGKILRLEADGSVPADNPFVGSPVWSLGHRNPQGLAWDGKRRLLAAEPGPGRPAEANNIDRGRTYGWPDVTGADGADAQRRGYTDPLVESERDTWAPSGIAWLGDSLWVAALRGERLLQLTLGADLKLVNVRSILHRVHGRLRDVVVGPDGALYVTTSNRDGRGTPREGDDRILRVQP